MPVWRTLGRRGRVYASRAKITAWIAANASVTETIEEKPAPVSALTPEPVNGPADTIATKEAPTTSKHPLRLILAGVFVGLAIIITTAFLNRHSAAHFPTKMQFDDSSVTARDALGNKLWVYNFKRPLVREVMDSFRNLDEYVHIADLKGDGSREILLMAPVPLRGQLRRHI